MSSVVYLNSLRDFDGWDYYRLKVRFRLHGVLYYKCAIAREPMFRSHVHAVLLIGDDLTIKVLPRTAYVFMTVGNLEEVSLNNIVFGRD